MKQQPFENKAAIKLKWLYAIFKHCKLPAGATLKHRAVLRTLLFYCNSPYDAKTWLSQQSIADDNLLSVATIKKVLADLQAWHVITIKQRFNDSNIYICHWDKLQGAAEAEAVIRPKNQLLQESSTVVAKSDIGVVAKSENAVVATFHESVVANKVATNVFKNEDLECITNVTEDNNSNVFYVWTSWNKAIKEHAFRSEPSIPSGGLKGNAIYEGIAKWITVNGSAWEERWKELLQEIGLNEFFKSGYPEHNFLPTLRWLFCPDKKSGECGIEKVLSGKYQSMRKKKTIRDFTEAELKHAMCDIKIIGVVD